MRRDEVRALGDLAGDAAAGIASQARDLHAGIAQRVFGALGPTAGPVRLAHDRISAGAYAAARALTGAVVRGGAQVAGLTLPPDAPSIGDSGRGRLAIGALNGAFGDRLHRRASPLRMSMTIRRDGRDVSADADELARAFPDATGRLVVFVHGLCETDEAWRLGSRRSVPYGDRLRAELGYTPIYVRYNSGRHISHNGRDLDALLDAVVAGWPVEVSEIALVGHSMGGLVARGACHYAGVGGTGSWRERVRHVFMLGTPHTGAPLELAANAACHAASLLPETRPFAAPLKARSAGVKDLGYGYVVDEDWEGHDPDAFWTNTGTVVPFLPGANHYFVSATVSREADARLARVMGDLLVLHRSAWAQRRRGERLQFPVERYRHLGGATHFDLLNHPAVYVQIRRWLAGARPQLPAPPSVS
jgi:PGAP1-like protein